MSMMMAIMGSQGIVVDPSPTIPLPQLWFDASDTSTLTVSSGLVSAWESKGSISGAIASASGSNRPTMGSGFVYFNNGTVAQTSDANQQRLSYPASEAVIPVIRTFYTVTSEMALQPSSFSSICSINTTTGTGGQNHYGPTIFVSAGDVAAYWRTGSTHAITWTPASISSTPHILRTRFQSLSMRDTRYNSDSVVSNTQTVLNIVPAAFHLGIERRPSAGNPSNSMTGRLHEVLAYDYVPDATEDSQIMAYLASKWNITL